MNSKYISYDLHSIFAFYLKIEGLALGIFAAVCLFFFLKNYIVYYLNFIKQAGVVRCLLIQFKAI